jgi:thiol-disulfide isomerase/thioredoxin
MDTFYIASLIALWIVVLINLLLTLRMVRWHRGVERTYEREVELEQRSELLVGMPAPEFRAKALTNGREFVRLADYAGHKILLLFLSPKCDLCRTKLPTLIQLSKQAKEQAGIEFVLVSDRNSAETHAWINMMREKDHIEIPFRILVAPTSISDFLMNYNPLGIIPYFCFVNEQGIVQARDPMDTDTWRKLQREWEGNSAKVSSLKRMRL